jgi:hypothetical protein
MDENMKKWTIFFTLVVRFKCKYKVILKFNINLLYIEWSEKILLFANVY